ncbi:MAG: hypothetical protein CBB79_05300 [Synechococcus sp. TMED19]|nr:MAG: hypothetical protein CBB79_05300 [Synechococcus sp. TMED19]
MKQVCTPVARRHGWIPHRNCQPCWFACTGIGYGSKGFPAPEAASRFAWQMVPLLDLWVGMLLYFQVRQ